MTIQNDTGIHIRRKKHIKLTLEQNRIVTNCLINNIQESEENKKNYFRQIYKNY